MTNCVGLGSDRAAVMFGRRGGLGVLLGKDAPLLTHVHCVAHRLSLACSDAAKDIPFLVLQGHTQELVHSCQWLRYSCWKVRINAGYNGRTPLKSKTISNDQELIQSDPTSCPQNQKGNN